MRKHAVSYAALITALLGTPVAAQVAEPTDVQEVVVTGSRAKPRLATESSAPVSTYSAKALTDTGFTDLSHAIQYLDPSVNFAGSVNAGGAANAKGPTLLGLGQDEVLVLVDGKRRAASSLINFNNTIGRGEVPVDLSLIPMSAIDHVEVLRDGASAEYGSDAIAGVINVILKTDAQGGMLAGQAGVTERGDGANGELTGRIGLPIGNGGSLTLSGDLRGLNPMNRADIDTRAGVAGRITNQQGEDGTADLDLAMALRLPVGDGRTAYSDATFARRLSANTIQFRLPNVDPAVFPQGFLPRTRLELLDVQGTVGIRGQAGGWKIDLSDTPGYDQADFTDDDTANPSLGATSPTGFDAGGARYLQNVVNLDISRPFNLLAGANLAGGLEERYEAYRLRAGAPASFVGAGAYGFPGFNPPSPVDQSRTAFSAYLDGELSPLKALRLGAAARFEDYSDFGSKATGKLSIFYKPARQIAFRGTVSTGFRAPALQQNFFSTVTSQNNGGVLQNVGTFAVDDPVAKALGASALRPETSVNLSGGLVFTPTSHFTLTADVFRVDVHDRIALSETLGDATVTSILLAHNITDASSARFFTNAADTRTQGFEVAAAWNHDFHSWGRLDVNAGYDLAQSRIIGLRTNPVIAAPDPANILLNTGSIDFLTHAQPSRKADGVVAWSIDRYRLTFDATEFGAFRYVPSTAPANHDQMFGAKTVFDLIGSVRLTSTLSADLGVLNLTDVYNDEVSAAFQGGTGLRYPEGGGVGFEGRQYFVRLTAAF